MEIFNISKNDKQRKLVTITGVQAKNMISAFDPGGVYI